MMRRAGYIVAVLVVALIASACGKAPSRPATEVVVVQRDLLPSDPRDDAWRTAPSYAAQLLLQDMVEPRLLEESTKEVRVRSIASGGKVSFRLEWDDPTRDELPGIARFADACALQLPAKVEPDGPDPQMGGTGHPVEITYWSAFWQSAADGRGDTIKDIYPGAAVDHYPFQAPSLQTGSDAQQAMESRYAPALALGNLMARRGANPVQDLVAEGPGTLTAVEKPLSEGRGIRTDKGWAVVISRPLPKGLEPGGQSRVAFAVWNGSHKEVGARKMRSAWVPLLVEKER